MLECLQSEERYEGSEDDRPRKRSHLESDIHRGCGDESASQASDDDATKRELTIQGVILSRRSKREQGRADSGTSPIICAGSDHEIGVCGTDEARKVIRCRFQLTSDAAARIEDGVEELSRLV